ncbi:MAG: DMT family transporter [Proteobacteria bacterium]|nr:DMT family transporter [Pseudomonadota bacterium]
MTEWRPGRTAISSSGTYRHLLLLILLASLWSSSFAAIKIGVGTIPPLTLAAGRIAVAAAVLYALIAVRGQRLPRSARLWALFFLIGVTGNALPFTLIAWGEERIDSGLAAILMAVMPPATVLLTHVFTRDERLTAPKLIGVAMGFAGVVLLIGPEVLRGLGGQAGRQLAVAGGAVCYAVTFTIARFVPPSPPAVRSAAVMICASVQIIPLALLVDQPWALSPSPASVAALVYLGLLPTALATIIFFQLISARGATFVALNNYMIPVLGVIWGAAFLGERISLQALGALALILIGIGVTSLRPRRP